MYEWFLDLNGAWAYWALFAALLGGAFGLPIPEDLPLLIAGALVHQGHLKIIPAVIFCYSAVVLGDVIIFRIGRRLGPALFTKRWFRRRVTLSTIKKLRTNLEKRSFWMILLARHLFYLRTVTFLFCGAVKMSFARFLIADMLAALTSLPVMLGLGYLFSEHFAAVVELLTSVKRVALFISLPILIVGGYLWWRRKIRTRAISDAAPATTTAPHAISEGQFETINEDSALPEEAP
jgi:membrane protein DedA with SNARE-associated domain